MSEVPKKISAIPAASSVNTNDYTVLVDGNTVQNKRATVAQIMAAAGGGTVTSVNAAGAQGVTVSGGPVTSSGSLTIGLGAITPTSVAASGPVAGTNLSGTNTGDQTISLTGDVTAAGGTGTLSTSLAAGAVTNAKLADMTGPTLKGRTSGTGAPQDCTPTQVTALLSAVVGDSGSGGTKGLVPAPSAGDAAAKKFLKADGTWAVPLINDLLPNQTGNSGKVLKTDGSNTSWQADATAGTVTSVAVTGDGNITSSGGPVTSSGTISLALSATGVTPGTYGSTTQSPSITVDAQGRVSGAGSNSIAFPVTSVSGKTGAVSLNVNDVANITSIKLDDFSSPDDNTDLNATTGRHGLLPKLGGGTTTFLRADGTWATPAGGGGGISDGDKGDITVSGSGATWTIDNAVVNNTKLADVATSTFKGRTTAGTGAPEDLTATQATALLNTFTSTLKGLAPSSGGGTTTFLRADGTWAAPASSGGEIFDPGWDGQGQVITGEVILIPVASTQTLTQAALVADVSGSVTVTVKKYTPSAGALGSATTLGTVALSSAVHTRSTGLSWAVTAGDVLEFTPSSITSVKRLRAKLGA